MNNKKNKKMGKHIFWGLTNLFLLTLFLSSLLFSCSDDNEKRISGVTYQKSLISIYITPETITTENVNSGIKVSLNGNRVYSGKKFKALSKYYNDTSYNKYVYNGPRAAVNDSINKVTIKTVEDFDSSHPAGSDITDLVECQYVSYYDFIKNNYKTENSERMTIEGLGYYSYIEGAEIYKRNLSDICIDNSKLMGPEFMLKFKETPDKKGIYTFNMEMFFSGKVVTKTFKYAFE